ncbi:arsenate reductase family protein [Ascidiimonas sp. W6]|uniref:arsenate reductase family protein n=1 Tax=Ascidiimonas meishanensis TaxID=3128903 RepID=UPI0030EF5DB7
MKKVYYLNTCDTCKRILKELDLPPEFKLQDIKSDPLTDSQLAELYKISGNYEALFSKRARLYKERGYKDQVLSEKAIRELILEHYTFLKRPVILLENQLFIGNSKKNVEAAFKAIHG